MDTIVLERRDAKSILNKFKDRDEGGGKICVRGMVDVPILMEPLPTPVAFVGPVRPSTGMLHVRMRPLKIEALPVTWWDAPLSVMRADRPSARLAMAEKESSLGPGDCR